MKRGCFLTTITIFTILIGAGLYIGDKYGDQIIQFFKGRVIEITADSIEKYFDRLRPDEYSDSLKILWTEVSKDASLMKMEEGLNYMSTIMMRIDRYTKDSLFTSEEFENLKEFIKNETRQKN
ncbi:hypothetical protein ASZ90_005146 [hydrocarbon metagenome]|uniref:Uncharacterized protein n=1 Tax=hydrocarbon metagenome TaxID=938273 RepID=A0A0W8FW13_9ZZZZ